MSINFEWYCDKCDGMIFSFKRAGISPSAQEIAFYEDRLKVKHGKVYCFACEPPKRALKRIFGRKKK